MRRRETDRVLVLAATFLALAATVFCRLLWIQVLHRERYDNPTNINYHRQYRLPAQKGDLLDREGRPLARCEQVASIAANPQQVADPGAAAALLAPLLNQDPRELATAIARRWRRVMLRRQVSRTVELALKPLADAGVLSFTDEPCEPTYSLYVFPRQFQPAPSERASLAVLLAVSPRDLESLMGLEAGAIRYQSGLDAATAKQVEQLSLAGLLVQQNPVRTERAAWLEPIPGCLDELPIDPAKVTRKGEDWRPRLKDAVWQALAPLWVGTEPPVREQVESRLRAPFIYLRREVPQEVGEAVEALLEQHAELGGVSVHHEYTREYPQGALARILLGRCDVDERGVSGLEALFNQILNGVDGYRKVTVTAFGRPIIQEREELVPPVHGKCVELSLDAVIQGYAEEAVQQAVAENEADWGLAVVVDPATGEVLAMANAADTGRGVPEMNRCMTTAFEPGSVIKPLVVAMALDAGVARPETTVTCTGRIQVGRSVLSCIKEHGPETVAEAVRDSCNSVMVELSRRLQQPLLEKGFNAAGLLGRTGLGLAGQEATGAIFENTDDGRWSVQKVATVSYGKGIQTTAVGLVRAYCALLNGGRLPSLHQVRRICDRDGGVVVEPPHEPGPRLHSEATADRVKKMLHTVVADPHGTGHLAASKLYDLGGKTGTSIAYGAGDRRVVSFIGFAPYDQPRLLVLVSVAEPRVGLRYGSTTCGPAARAILERGLQYLGLPPRPPAKGAGQ